MRINIDLATAGVASVTCATNGSCAHVLKRRDSVPVEIAFIAADGTGPAALTAPNITVALRTAGSYSGADYDVDLFHHGQGVRGHAQPEHVRDDDGLLRTRINGGRQPGRRA